MRQAYELGWANTYVFAKSRPYCLHMDDIWFRAPVEIGAMLYFNSQICYVQVYAVQNTVIPKITKINVVFDLHCACRITTSRLECLQRWWTPRLGRCPSPMFFTSPSLPRRRHRPSLCQRLTMRWGKN